MTDEAPCDFSKSHSDYCDRCRRVHKRWTYLLDENEREFGNCNDCLDRMYESAQERREWDYYHS